MPPPAIFLSFAESARAHYYRDGAVAGLRALGDVLLNETGEVLDSKALIEAAKGCQVIVCDRATRGDAALFAHSPDLAIFMRCAVDVRNIDIDAASAHGVLVTHASAGFANAVAEWVLGMMFDLSRNLSTAVLTYRAGQTPEVRMGRELRGAALGVLGYGAIGRRLCDSALALGMHVAVSDPHAVVADPRIAQQPIDELLDSADYLVCLVPATPETANLMNDARFAQMKPGAFFINAARGEVVDDDPLLRALDSGRIAGCALDVGRAADQMPAPRLAAHPRVLATPHTGGLTPEAVDHQANETVAQLELLLQGRVPAGALNIAAATRLARIR
ncbi:MAG: NAD(P)-dependent oxidoreductase [Variovorax sp.]